jgi:hypothetical protein
MDWDVVLPRFGAMLTAHGVLAILGVEQLPAPWDDELWAIRRRYSVIPNFQYHDVLKSLGDRRLFQPIGRRRTEPVSFTQSLGDYIESFHGRAAFSRERMSPQQVTAFHDEIRTLVAPLCPDRVELQIVTEVIWGKPRDARARSPES